MSLSIDLLTSYYQSRAGIPNAAGAGSAASAAAKTKYAPTPPWDSKATVPRESALVTAALGGHHLIDESAAKIDLAKASGDYKKLFAIYQGLNSLYGLAGRAGDTKLTPTEQAKAASVFEKGLKEVSTYVDKLDLDQIRLTRGVTQITTKTDALLPKDVAAYKTASLFTGDLSTQPDRFQGDVKFSLKVNRLNTEFNLNFDLSEMGATPRTLPNVVTYLNDKLQANGLSTRFEVNRTTAEPRTIQSGSQTITLPAVGDAFALGIKGESTEKLTFSAQDADTGVFVATKSGNPDPDKNVKTDDAVYQSRLAKIDPFGTAGGNDGAKIFDNPLESSISTVRASQTDADGNLYVLADITGATSKQDLKGQSDVALMKYDAAGKLLFTRTLGASDSASGLALAVNSDGKIAVAGSIKGDLTGAVNGPLNSTTASGLTDSFVTLYGAQGDEVWTQRRGAAQDDEATAIAFGSSGQVLVAGRTKSAMPGGSAVSGGWDNYLTAVGTTTAGLPTTLFTQQLGSTGEDRPAGLVVNGSTVYLASKESGAAVVRSFELGASSATLTGTRNLGNLEGGSVAGLAIDNGHLVLGGDTRNGALNVSGTGEAYHGGVDGFVAQMDLDLASTASDAISYVGGTGDDKVSAFAAKDGELWLAGTASDSFPGPAKIGTKDGFLTRIDAVTGQLAQTQRLTGKDGYTDVTTIAVTSKGVSSLDRLGLPGGKMDYDVSQLIVAGTSARAGDQFQIRTREGGSLATVTLAANDTFETLASKIRSASGFRAKVEVLSSGDSRYLKISPLNATASVEVLNGPDGKDLLSSLKMEGGLVRNTILKNGKSVSADGSGVAFGLGLPSEFDLGSAAGVKAAQASLLKSLGKVRDAYRELENLAKPKSVQTATRAATGPAPAYLTAQIANYQAALNRLGG
jgi:hypothetical protein